MRRLKPDVALLAAPPCFYKNVKDAGVISFYREIIKATPQLKTLLLPHPPFVRRADHIGDHPHFKRGISQNGRWNQRERGGLALYERDFATFPGFQVFVGSEKTMVEAVKHGGSGAICGMANIFIPS